MLINNLTIGIVVGEISGDLLGADLIKSFAKLMPNTTISIIGIVGPNILALQKNYHNINITMLYPMEDIAVMGIIEPIKHLPKLFKIRSGIINYFIANKQNIDFFIGIDAPDFNIGIELKLKAAGIKTFHYVSPSVWAWRKNRIFKIKKAIDGMIAFFPFEETIYKQHNIPIQIIGHPFAQQIANLPPSQISSEISKIALLPGSRWSEIKRMGLLYLQVAEKLIQHNNNLSFIMPLVNIEHRAYLENLYEINKFNFNIQFVVGNTREYLANNIDLALATSGTITLELMLLKIPMVVAYKMNYLTYFIAKRLVKLPYISLPNLIAQEYLVPEYIQQEANIDKLTNALLKYLESPQDLNNLRLKFQALHHRLDLGGSDLAAQTILKWLS